MAEKLLVALAAKPKLPRLRCSCVGRQIRKGKCFEGHRGSRGGAARAQKMEKFHTLAQPPNQHVPGGQHLAYDFRDLRGAEVKPPVKILDRIENFAVGQMRIIERRDLRTAIGQQIDIFGKPTILLGLIVKESAGIWRRKRDLQGPRIHLLCEFKRLLDGFACLARKSKNESAVNK